MGDGKRDRNLSYEEAVQRADYARSFVDHPYWAMMSRMLAGTISSETERMLESDENLPLSRAAIAMCRKILKMPFIDIEQGKAVELAYRTAMEKQVARFGAANDARTGAEKGNPWESRQRLTRD